MQIKIITSVVNRPVQLMYGETVIGDRAGKCTDLQNQLPNFYLSDFEELIDHDQRGIVPVGDRVMLLTGNITTSVNSILQQVPVAVTTIDGKVVLDLSSESSAILHCHVRDAVVVGTSVETSPSGDELFVITLAKNNIEFTVSVPFVCSANIDRKIFAQDVYVKGKLIPTQLLSQLHLVDWGNIEVTSLDATKLPIQVVSSLFAPSVI